MVGRCYILVLLGLFTLQPGYIYGEQLNTTAQGSALAVDMEIFNNTRDDRANIGDHTTSVPKDEDKIIASELSDEDKSSGARKKRMSCSVCGSTSHGLSGTTWRGVFPAKPSQGGCGIGGCGSPNLPVGLFSVVTQTVFPTTQRPPYVYTPKPVQPRNPLYFTIHPTGRTYLPPKVYEPQPVPTYTTGSVYTSPSFNPHGVYVPQPSQPVQPPCRVCGRNHVGPY